MSGRTRGGVAVLAFAVVAALAVLWLAGPSPEPADDRTSPDGETATSRDTPGAATGPDPRAPRLAGGDAGLPFLPGHDAPPPDDRFERMQDDRALAPRERIERLITQLDERARAAEAAGQSAQAEAYRRRREGLERRLEALSSDPSE